MGRQMNWSFMKFKEKPEFESWFSDLHNPGNEKAREEVQLNLQSRLVRIELRETMRTPKRADWHCEYCSLENQTIWIDSVPQQPSKRCRLCGAPNTSSSND